MTAKSLVQDSVTLFSLPDIYFQVDKMLNDLRFNASDIGKVLSKDPALSLRLLKVVNSAFYGFPARIDTISRAVTVIGIDDLRQLVLATAIVDKFNHIPDCLLDMTAFWLRSIKCGAIARQLAKHCSVLHSERLFLIGLLHDIGLLVLLVKVPDKSLESLLISNSNRDLLFATEEELFGFTHADVGAELIKLWGLPDAMSEAVLNYQIPERAVAYPLDTYILALADKLCDLAGQGETIESILGGFSEELYSYVNLNQEQLADVLEESEQECEQLFNAMHKKV